MLHGSQTSTRRDRQSEKRVSTSMKCKNVLPWRVQAGVGRTSNHLAGFNCSKKTLLIVTFLWTNPLIITSLTSLIHLTWLMRSSRLTIHTRLIYITCTSLLYILTANCLFYDTEAYLNCKYWRVAGGLSRASTYPYCSHWLSYAWHPATQANPSIVFT